MKLGGQFRKQYRLQFAHDCPILSKNWWLANIQPIKSKKMRMNLSMIDLVLLLLTALNMFDILNLRFNWWLNEVE